MGGLRARDRGRAVTEVPAVGLDADQRSRGGAVEGDGLADRDGEVVARPGRVSGSSSPTFTVAVSTVVLTPSLTASRTV